MIIRTTASSYNEWNITRNDMAVDMNSNNDDNQNNSIYNECNIKTDVAADMNSNNDDNQNNSIYNEWNTKKTTW